MVIVPSIPGSLRNSTGPRPTDHSFLLSSSSSLFSPPTHSSVLFSSLNSFLFFSRSFSFLSLLFFSFFDIFFLSLVSCYFPVTHCDNPPCCFSIGRDPSSPRWRVARPRPRPTPGPRATPAILYVSSYPHIFIISIILTMAGAKTLQVSSLSTPLPFFSLPFFFFFFAAFVRRRRLPAFLAQHLARDHGSHQ